MSKSPPDDLGRYKFETDKASFRSKDDAVPEMKKLLVRLGFPIDRQKTLTLPFEPKLLQFVTNCHLAIAWYDDHIDKEMRMRKLYFTSSIAILAILPALLFAAAYFLGKTGNAAALTTSELGAVLTGIFAFYRGISAWLDKRQVVGGYAKASSDLKEILYGFEEAWNSEATKQSREQEFEGAIELATRKCRTIVQQETQQYFSTLTYPTLDLGSILRGASTDAGALVQGFSGVAPAILTSGNLRTTPSSNGAVPSSASSRLGFAKVDLLRQQFDELSSQLDAAIKTGDSNKISSTRSARDKALLDLRSAQLDATLLR